MTTFFSGTTNEEIAKLSQTPDDIKATITQFFGMAENVGAIKEILNAEYQPLDRQIALILMVKEAIPSLQEVSADDIYRALSRWVNKTSQKAAVSHKFNDFQRLVNGKIIQTAVKLEHKTDETAHGIPVPVAV